MARASGGRGSSFTLNRTLTSSRPGPCIDDRVLALGVHPPAGDRPDRDHRRSPACTAICGTTRTRARADQFADLRHRPGRSAPASCSGPPCRSRRWRRAAAGRPGLRGRAFLLRPRRLPWARRPSWRPGGLRRRRAGSDHVGPDSSAFTGTPFASNARSVNVERLARLDDDVGREHLELSRRRRPRRRFRRLGGCGTVAGLAVLACAMQKISSRRAR